MAKIDEIKEHIGALKSYYNITKYSLEYKKIKGFIRWI